MFTEQMIELTIMIDPEEPGGLTWRPELGLAGRAGKRQALAEPVHPVEANGHVRLRHGLQVFSRGEGNPAGLVSKSRLRRAEPGHARRPSLGEKNNNQSERSKV